MFIKDVAQAIPIYIMSYYKLHEGVCLEIEVVLDKFLWGSKSGDRKIHWLSWERLFGSKGI